MDNWLRADEAEESLIAPEASIQVGASQRMQPTEPESRDQPASAHSSKSKLEPVLRDTGTLERLPGPRKPGRPRMIASWFEKVAEIMADGTSLKAALAMCGLSLSRGEIRACYRNRTLQALYQEARRRYLAEHYGKKPTLRAKIGRYL